MATTATGKVRRNSKRLQQIIETAHNVHVHTQQNYYQARPIDDERASEILQRELDRFRFAYVRDLGDGNYSLQVSNEWFDFEANA